MFAHIRNAVLFHFRAWSTVGSPGQSEDLMSTLFASDPCCIPRIGDRTRVLAENSEMKSQMTCASALMSQSWDGHV